MAFKFKLLAFLLLIGLVSAVSIQAADQATDRVPSVSGALNGQVDEDSLEPMPESYKHEPAVHPGFLDLSSDPNADVKVPGGLDRVKGLKRLD